MSLSITELIANAMDDILDFQGSSLSGEELKEVYLEVSDHCLMAAGVKKEGEVGINADRSDVKDQVIEAVGLPSRHRYNWLVSQAVDELKIGGDWKRASVYAELARAEAIFMAGDR